jgi:hypothetical protein
MFKTATLALVISFLAVTATLSKPFHGGVSTGVSGCQYATDGTDGCPGSMLVTDKAGATHTGLYKVSTIHGSNLWTYAAQSGQVWAGLRPASITRNVPCEDYFCGPWTADASLVHVSTATTAQALEMTKTPDNPSGVAGVCSAYSSTNKNVRCNTDVWIGTGHVNAANGNQFLVDTPANGVLAVGQRIQFGCNPSLQGAYCRLTPKITASCAAVGGLACWTFDGAAITDPTAQGLGTYSPCGYADAYQGATLVYPANLSCYGTVTLDIEGWWFDDAGLFSTGHANIIFKNNHLTIGGNYCTVYGNGNTLVGFPAGYSIESSSWIGDYDKTAGVTGNGWCSGYANLYKQANDPGLATLGTFTGHITSGVLSVDSGLTGQFGLNQFADWSGRTAGYQAQMWKANGGGFEIAHGPCNRNSGQNTCVGGTDTALNVSSTTFTVGPIYPSAPYFTAGGGLWTTAHMAYVIYDGTYAFQSSAMDGGQIEYNSCHIISWAAVHASCFTANPATPNTSTRPYMTYRDNVSWYDSLARPGYGTAAMTLFATDGTSNAGPNGWQVSTTNVTFSNNILFGNNSTNIGGALLSPDSPAVVSSLATILNQGAGTTFKAIIGTVSFIGNHFGTTGALGACRVDANVIVTNPIVSTANDNIDTQSPVSCPTNN